MHGGDGVVLVQSPVPDALIAEQYGRPAVNTCDDVLIVEESVSLVKKISTADVPPLSTQG